MPNRQGIFDEAAVRSLALALQSQSQRGVAVERVGVQTRITFQLENQ
jgi:hypothetical protein